MPFEELSPPGVIRTKPRGDQVSRMSRNAPEPAMAETVPPAREGISMDKITEAIADFNADTVENRAKRRITCTKGHKHVLEVEREDGFPLHFCTHCCSWID